MLLEKQKLLDKIENLRETFSKKITILGKDFSDVIIFISIYCGNNPVLAEEVSLKMFGLKQPKFEQPNFNKTGQEKKVKREGEKGIFYKIESYDKSVTLNLIVSKMYVKIEKVYDTSSSYYCAEYVFDEKGNFVRIANQKSFLLEKNLEFEEKSEGNLNYGVCFSQITEKNEAVNVDLFKILTTKDEEIYYSYKCLPDIEFYCRAPNAVKSIPSISSIGMKELSQLLEMQFSKNLVTIDRTIFNELKKSAKVIFNGK